MAIDIMTAQVSKPYNNSFALLRASEYIDENDAESVIEGLVAISSLLLIHIEKKLQVPQLVMLQGLAAVAAKSENNPPIADK